MGAVTTSTMRTRLARGLPATAAVAVVVAALVVMPAELHALGGRDLVADIVATAPTRLALALALTALSYAVLAGNELLALGDVGLRLRRRHVASASFLASAISHSVGLSMLSGASLRYRFYSRWGVTREEFQRTVFLYSAAVWLGLGALGGVSLLASPPPVMFGPASRQVTALAGGLLIATVVAWLAATAVRPAPLRAGRLVLPLPAPVVAMRQLLLSILDWALAGGVLYVLLPAGAPGFVTYLGAFLAATLIGIVSHVPGGLGVFEGLMVVLLGPYLGAAEVVPALVVYRAVYYLLPLTIAVVGLLVDELRQRRAFVARAAVWLGTVTESLTPRLLATLAFVAGAVLLFSGATPASPGRLDLIAGLLPLGVVEASHFLGSIAGVGLLILSHGLSRRLDAAYYLSFGLILVGIAASLSKGLDYEEAALLAAVLALLYRARGAFDRRAAFFEARFSAGWTAALAGTLMASVWLGVFAFQHVDYANELWWQFELHGEASRFLRASVGAAVAVLAIGAARLIRHAPHEAAMPTDAELGVAARIIAAQSATTPYLVQLRDKAIVFNDERTAFVMYGVQGRTWVALGDPVGPDAAVSGLIGRFLERCDDFGGVPVFYQVGPRHLHRYADFGLTFVKMGEEARIDVRAFCVHGRHGARRRQALRRLETTGATFRVVPAEAVPAMLPQLRAVSDEWLSRKAGAEKGFALGFFDDAYLGRFPVAIVEREGRVVAFGNLWLSADRVEFSIDLMRYSHEAPNAVMEALLVRVVQWGQQQGYQRFVLGMAPLSGFEQSPVAPLWHRLGSFLYEHANTVYRFQGLRAYKEKFDPLWEPRYLAYAGGLNLPRALADVAALIAGGYIRIFAR